MRITTRRVLQASAVLSVVATVAACGSSSNNSSSTSATTAASSGSTSGGNAGGGALAAKAPAGAPAIVIGGANFAESTLVANIYGDALKKAGWKVTVKSDLGARETVQPALESGHLNMVIDYAGNLLTYYNSSAPALSPEATATTLAPYLAKKGLKASKVSPAADADAIAVNQQTEAKYHLSSLAELAPVAGKLTFGGPPECRTRITCVPGLKKDYGVTFKSTNTALDAAGPETISALKNNQIQVGRLDSSDPSIAANHFTVLADPKHFQDAGNLLPEFSVKIDSPQLEAVLNQVSATLTTADLVQLNAQIASKQEAPASVAASFASAKGLS